MVSKTIEKALNDQLAIEAWSSHLYLAMASWAEVKGFAGISAFLFRHSDEERQHMLKLVHYVNERGGKASVPPLDKPKVEFSNVRDLFQSLLEHEIEVTESINEVVDQCLKEKDYTTHNFMQWYVAEQIEEEAMARNIMDKLDLIGNDKGGMYLFDRDIGSTTGDH